ncbi:MAG: HD domain-containing protein [Oscillospiraceae bacterium]|jgi:tRNA nucleotidyltransferase (CCA-adding enzyme)|nr:HD domain-containing protein [Oscillospiraceae bacterium]
MYQPPYVKKIISLLEEGGYEAYTVGGCVRDALIGVTPSDFDVTSSAAPEEVRAVMGEAGIKVHDTGLKHGTVTAVSDGVPVEITTFRVDGGYSDNRRPDSVAFTRSLKDDLRRRDFTVNAMAYSERTGIVDFFGGRDDLKNKVIRAVGNAETRFNEDGLRILRALRFACVLGFAVDGETASAAHKLRGLIKNVSGERIAGELNKLVCGEVSGTVSRFADVFAEFIPEITACENFDQRSVYHDRDVLTHTLNAMDCAPADKITRLTLLFHDLGKPPAFKFENGRGRFPGHAEISAQIADRAFRRLKYDGETREKALLLIKYHNITIRDDKKAVKRLLNKFGEEAFFRLIDVRVADDTAKAEEHRARTGEARRAAETARGIIGGGECFSTDGLAVKGGDVLELGYKGREIGDALNYLLQAVINEKTENDKNGLIDYLLKRGK